MYARKYGEDPTKAGLVTIDQMCAYLNLGKTTVRKLAEEAGAFRKIGRNNRISPPVMLSYIEREYG